MSKFIQVITTVDKQISADKICQLLIESKLAGCVQILGPIKSTYIWQGKIEKAKEWLIIIKTRGDLYDQVEGIIKKIHPYKVPEILAIPVSFGNKSYLDWLNKTLK